MKKIILLINILAVIPLYSFNLKKLTTLETGMCPKSVIISKDGTKAYSMNLEGLSVYAFDVQSKKIDWKIVFFPTPAKGWDYKNKKPISSYAEKPVEGALSHNGKFLWVSLHNGESVVVIDTDFKTEFKGSVMKAKLYRGDSKKYEIVSVKKIPVGKTPKVIAVSPDEKWVYIANWHSHTVSVIDTESYEEIKQIKVTRVPRGMAFTPDGKYCYIANMGDSILSLVDVNANHKVIKTFYVGVTPRHVVISPDGKYLYISLNQAGEVVKFSIETGKVIKKKYVGSNPRTLALSGDGKHILVVQYYDQLVSLMSAESLEILEKYPTGTHPVGVTFTPDDSEAWVVNYSSSTISVFKIIP